MNNLRAKGTEYGKLINYSGHEFKIRNEDGWEIFESTLEYDFEGPFKKLKDLKTYLETIEVDEIEESTASEVGLWDHICPAHLLAIEFENRDLPDYVRNTLDCYSLIDPEGKADAESGRRMLANYLQTISGRNNHSDRQGSKNAASEDGQNSSLV